MARLRVALKTALLKPLSAPGIKSRILKLAYRLAPDQLTPDQLLAHDASAAASLALEQLALERLFDPEVGTEYGVGRREKEDLVQGFKSATAQIETATSWLYHVVFATEILRVQRSVPGDVIECGCFKGGSTASLSLVCEKAGRRLLVCDSFEGLPEDERGAVHEYPHVGVFGFYRKGMYAGRLEEVKANIAKAGALSVCEFIPGYFSESLTALRDPLVFAFLDVDLASSMRDCIRAIWPLLADSCFIYTDDSCDMEVARIWFDDPWWQREVGSRAPGYVGTGCGLPLSPKFTSVGYARKVLDPTKTYGRVSWLHYPGEESTGRMAEMRA